MFVEVVTQRKHELLDVDKSVPAMLKHLQYLNWSNQLRAQTLVSLLHHDPNERIEEILQVPNVTKIECQKKKKTSSTDSFRIREKKSIFP